MWLQDLMFISDFFYCENVPARLPIVELFVGFRSSNFRRTFYFNGLINLIAAAIAIFTQIKISLMKKCLPILILFLAGCSLFEDTKLVDVKEVLGPCTIVLTDGTSVVSSGNIEISKTTMTITYRDEADKLWSLFKDDYTSYSCQ